MSSFGAAIEKYITWLLEQPTDCYKLIGILTNNKKSAFVTLHQRTREGRSSYLVFGE